MFGKVAMIHIWIATYHQLNSLHMWHNVILQQLPTAMQKHLNIDILPGANTLRQYLLDIELGCIFLITVNLLNHCRIKVYLITYFLSLLCGVRTPAA